MPEPFARTSLIFGPQSSKLKVVRNEMFTFSDFLLVCNFGVQVAAICVVHHNAQASFVHEGFLVGNDIRVSHRLQDMNLIDRVLSLFAIHL